MRRLVLLIGTLLLSSVVAWGQGTISGTVTGEDSGDPIGGALVVAVGEHHFNTRFAISGEDGSYIVDGLNPDTYNVVAQANIPTRSR
jgi:hypothetical protein